MAVNVTEKLDPADQTTSVWMIDARLPKLTSLNKDLQTDVCVIGGGIAGLSVAYLAVKQGRSVVVLEDGQIGSGQTGRTSAHLANALDDRYFEIERLHGAEGARLAAESHTAAIDRIEQIASEEGIECEFARVDGYLFLGDKDTTKTLDRELEVAHRAGLTEVTLVDSVPQGAFNSGPCLRFPRQAQFHPLKYLSGLAAAIIKHGGQIYTHTHAKKTEPGAPAAVHTESGHKVIASNVVVATNTPVNDMYVIHTKQAPYTTYVIGVRIPAGHLPRGLYWDTNDPYHYVRLESLPHETPRDGAVGMSEILIVGGEDHKTAQADDAAERHGRLEAWAREKFPMIRAVEFRWSGQVIEPIDGLAFIGHNPLDKPNMFIVTGDSGMGLTHGTIAGMLLNDLIAGRENPWQKLYDPTRKRVSALLEFAKENLNVAGEYAKWMTGGDVASENEIAVNSGAVIRAGLKKIAVYRDADGQCHRFSASCPHLGCPVGWNPVEHSWDCGCHGSRFDALGHVLDGPANTDLTPVETPKAAAK